MRNKRILAGREGYVLTSRVDSGYDGAGVNAICGDEKALPLTATVGQGCPSEGMVDVLWNRFSLPDVRASPLCSC